MSIERLEPLLALTVEGKGWSGDEDWERSGTPAEVHIDPESERELVEKLRTILAQRLEGLLAVAAMKVDALDLTSPALPTKREMAGLIAVLTKVTEVASALREMSPEDWDNGEGDDDDPASDPEPNPTSDQPSKGGGS